MKSAFPSANFLPQLPKKRFFGNLDPQVIEERKVGLQAFLDAIIRYPELSGSELFSDFINRVTVLSLMNKDKP